jgi:hypothetical protein
MEADLQRRQGGPTYALPACVGTPVSLTTITTSTVVTSTTTTATVTNTAYSTTTLQTTSTAPPQTICNHASTTITSTPTTTKTKTVHGATGKPNRQTNPVTNRACRHNYHFNNCWSYQDGCTKGTWALLDRHGLKEIILQLNMLLLLYRSKFSSYILYSWIIQPFS